MRKPVELVLSRSKKLDYWEIVEPYLINDDAIQKYVYHYVWGIVGLIIEINGDIAIVDWGDFSFSHSKEVKITDLRNIVAFPDKIGYLAHTYGKNIVDDSFYDIMDYTDYGQLHGRKCYVECEEVLRHKLSGRILNSRQLINKNLYQYEWVWVPRELNGKYIIHYEDKAQKAG